MRHLRKGQKLTQARFAKEVGLTAGQLSRLEAGEILTREVDLVKMAKVLDTEYEELKRQYFSDKFSQELLISGCSLETLDLAREKLLRLQSTRSHGRGL
ncbi:helix-turn-helix domain-containing protein [Rufibacter sp. LB8]|uniref:helix-turn-helix domain-containing protein n=1 Tax=Rufibacter sp. LB8 TaxID=2777781 RepID=UPI00351C85D3